MATKTRKPRNARKSPAARSSQTGRRPVTPEDLLRFVLVGDPECSPDGQHVLFMRKNVGEKNEYESNLWRVPTEGGEATQFTSGGKDSHGRWSRDGSRIAFIRNEKKKPAQIFIMPATGGEARALTKFPEGTISTFKWSPDGKLLAVSFRATDPEWTEVAKKKREETGGSTPARVIDHLWYRLDGDGYFGAQRFALYLVNAETGEHEQIFAKDTLGDFTFDFSPDGERLTITANTDPHALQKPWKDQIYLYSIKRRSLKTVPDLADGPKNSVRWSPDGKWLAFAGRQDRSDDLYSTENLRLFICDPETGQTRDLTGHTDYCMMAVTLSDTAEAKFGPTFAWQADSKHLIARIGWRGEGHIVSIPIKQKGEITFLTKGAYEYGLGSISEDGRCIALLRSQSTVLPEVAVGEFSKNGMTVRALTTFNRALLKELDIAEPEMHWVPSTDGARVQVWVMKPPASAKALKKKLPAVLEIHGGPHGQYGVPFFHEFQVLASAGYAVFYSNPRGSKGYGRAFCHAIRGAWGTKDWEDIQTVTAFMKKQSWVDTKRMGVMGGSYGGYMTNWVIGHTNEFAGAITDRCVSNLISMGGNSDFPDTPDRYWEGDFWSRNEARWASSPIQYMGNARTPTLIIHSEGDLRCNVEQSEQVFTVLQLHGVPSRFVRYPSSTSHGMSRMGPPDLRLHRLHQILNWWKEYLA